jgi:thymidine kinase
MEPRHGNLVVYFGPMKSGKSTSMFGELFRAREYADRDFIACRPEGTYRETSERDRHLLEELTGAGKTWIELPWERPERLFETPHLVPGLSVVAFDESHFFARGLEPTVDSILVAGFDVWVAGLDLDFRGEGYSCMPNLIAKANTENRFHKHGWCDIEGCREKAYYTQRLVDGRPARWDDDVDRVGDHEGITPADRNMSYEARCAGHHRVPGKPLFHVALRP